MTTTRTHSSTLFRRSLNACEAQQRKFEVWDYMCCSSPHQHEKRLMKLSYRTYCFTLPLISYIDCKAPAKKNTTTASEVKVWLTRRSKDVMTNDS